MFIFLIGYKDEDDYVDDLPQVIEKKKGRGPRNSVSAEAFGVWNKKKEFTAPKIPKTAEAEKAIREKLGMAFMFSALDEKDKDLVVGAMQERNATKDEKIIVEGDEGDCLYVVGNGTLSCTKIFKGNT